MSFKSTAVLVALAILLGVYLRFFRQTQEPRAPELGPEVWSAQEEDIERIEIAKGARLAFARDSEGKWRFEDSERSPVDPKRWGGIPTLVTGPASKRIIAEKPLGVAEFGLDNPEMEITLWLRGGRKDLRVLVGHTTPDGASHYVKVAGSDPVYTVDRSWAEVLGKLVTEPPRLETKPEQPEPAKR